MSHLKIKKPQTYLRFYHALAEPCPYLPEREEKKFFTKIDADNGDQTNKLLTEAGFRRSHDILSRPVCDNCRACISVRIGLKNWTKLTQSEKRVLKKNNDLIIHNTPSIADHTSYQLFQKYQAARHADSEMAQMSYSDYSTMTSAHFSSTYMLRFFLAEQLVGVLIYDKLGSDGSAVYSFFDPDLSARSLGRFMIYALCDNIRSIDGNYVYLGYFVQGSPKMSYKSNFSALEYFIDGQWQKERPSTPRSNI